MGAGSLRDKEFITSQGPGPESIWDREGGREYQAQRMHYILKTGPVTIWTTLAGWSQRQRNNVFAWKTHRRPFIYYTGVWEVNFYFFHSQNIHFVYHLLFPINFVSIYYIKILAINPQKEQLFTVYVKEIKLFELKQTPNHTKQQIRKINTNEIYVENTKYQ